jgi:hypothetical protein
VIIGFALRDRAAKHLFEYARAEGQPQAIKVGRINPYLVDGAMVALNRRTQPLSPSPALFSGNQPLDGGNYLFTDQEKIEFEANEPASSRFFNLILGSDEFLYSLKRWFLKLRDVEPNELRSMPLTKQRIELVKRWRASRTRSQTLALANTPSRIGIEIYPTSSYLAIPKVSSEHRVYIPVAILTPDIVCTDLMFLAPEGRAYHLAIMTSSMHMAWVRAVCGRLESRFRYSSGIVYNNFPWPTPTEAQRAAIERSAQGILDARAAHPGASLADLYDPLTMPPNLVAAHAANDRAVDAAYGQPRGFPTEAARLACLFDLYQNLVAPLDATPTRRRPRARRGPG